MNERSFTDDVIVQAIYVRRDGEGRRTLKDVASRVGVSINTASFVLNGSKSGTRVSEKTRQAIVEAAAEMGYQPNAIARSLRSQRTHTVGFYADFEALNAQNSFLTELIGGLQEGCAEYDLDLLLHLIRPSSISDGIADAILDCRVEGLVLFAPPGNELAERLVNCSLPVVAVVDLVENLPLVRVDDEGGGKLQAAYLAGRGHKRILYRQAHNAPISSRVRMESFETHAESLGMKVHRGRRLVKPYNDLLASEDIQLIESGCTAIVCWEDNSAHGTASHLETLGYRVPDQIEVVGFNGVPSAIPARYKIPTVVAPWRQVGTHAIHILSSLTKGEPVNKFTVLPVTFDTKSS